MSLTLKQLIDLKELLSTDSISTNRLTINSNFLKLKRGLSALIDTLQVNEGPNIIVDTLQATDIKADSISIPKTGSYLFNVNTNGEITAKSTFASVVVETPRVRLSPDPTLIAFQAGEIRWSGTDFVGWDGTQWVSFTAGSTGGQSNTTSNLGIGDGLALAKAGVNLPFKSIKAGTGITFDLTTDTNTIIINGAGSGYSGFSGISGFTGVSGFSGYSGTSGEIGTSGVSGFTGKSGQAGLSGFSGLATSGFSGMSGKSGASTSGFSGMSGMSGISGSVGPAGTSGQSGYQGTPGIQGVEGPIGPAGSSGFSGAAGASGFSGFSSAAFPDTFTPGTINVANVIIHSLVSTDITVTLTDLSTNEIIIPDQLIIDNGSQISIYFAENPAGEVRVVVMATGGIVGAMSGFSGKSGKSGYTGFSGYTGVSGYSGMPGIISSLSAIGASPNTDGATLTGSVLNLEPANALFGGILTTSAQDIVGTKTFDVDIFVNGLRAGKGAGSEFSPGTPESTCFGVALFNNIGNYNSAFGYGVLYNNTTGEYNDGHGYLALNKNTIGIGNSAFGYFSLENNDVNVGSPQISGDYNSAFGGYSLNSNINGSSNVGFVYKAGFNVTIGNFNTFIGTETGLGITIGNYNTIIGSQIAGLAAGLSNNLILSDGQGNIKIQSDSTGTTQFFGGLRAPIINVTSTYPITASDSTINATSGTFTITLPSAVDISGRIYIIKNSGAGTITLATTSSQTIDGDLTQDLTEYQSHKVQSNGANWIII